uniref:Glycine N-acyltransferase-like protein n=1 Tax=Sparus aurata TaxID=8175 RepID=A0A671TKR8_SPAAU
VLGGVLHIPHNNSCQLEMCVDSWPTFTTAICCRQKQVYLSLTVSLSNPWPHVSSYKKYSIEFYAVVLALESVFGEKIWINASFSMMKKVTKSHCFCVSGRAAKADVAAANFHSQPVPRRAHGGSQESLNHVRACIRHLPNYCVTDETGRPVSWMLSDELCELRMAYTLPEYRRAGRFLALSLTRIGRMISVCLSDLSRGDARTAPHILSHPHPPVPQWCTYPH